MSNGSIEILGARERRRRWRVEDKLRIVAETEEAGASLREVAARHDVYPNLLSTWRRQVRRGQLVAERAVHLLPVRVTDTVSLSSSVSTQSSLMNAADVIEISLPDGSQVRVGKEVSLTALRRVMLVLRG